MLPWSVIASPGCPSSATLATASTTRAAPSSIENSVWLCRWTNDDMFPGPVVPTWSPGSVHKLWIELQGCDSPPSRVRAADTSVRWGVLALNLSKGRERERGGGAADGRPHDPRPPPPGQPHKLL